jgi:hypothetical protein
VREIVDSEEFAAVVSHETQVRFHIHHRNTSLARNQSGYLRPPILRAILVCGLGELWFALWCLKRECHGNRLRAERCNEIFQI